VSTVRAEMTEFQPPPQRFEAGTPAVAEIIALGAAIDYVHEVGIEAIAQQEAWLLAETLPRLRAVDGLRLLVAEGPQVPVISFVMDGVHPHDLGTALDLEGIAVRAGLHCAEPLFSALGVHGSVRASLSFYNTIEEVDALCAAIRQASKLLR